MTRALRHGTSISNRRGAAFLLAVYLASLACLLLGGVSLQRTVVETRAAELSRNNHQALFLGEAGLDRAIAALRTNATAVLKTPTLTENVSATGSYTYLVTVTPEGLYRVESTGRAAGATSRVVALVSLPNPVTFRHALFASHSLWVLGTDTGSMDSRASRVFAAAPISHGDLGVNSTTLLPDKDGNLNTPPLMAAMSSKIRGDLYVGPGGDPAVLAWVDPGDSTLSGQKRSASESKPFPPVRVPSTAIDLGDLALTSQQRCLAPGTYVVRNVNLKGTNPVLCTTGPVNLYVTGTFNGGDGELYGQPSGSLPYAQQYSPENLRIFVSGTDPLDDKGQPTYSVGGGKFAAATLYAPQRSFSMLGGDWLGGVIVQDAFLWGKFLFFPANTLLYDDALHNQEFQVGPRTSIIMWSLE